MSLSLAGWFHEGLMMEGGVLSIDRAYFDISGGRERWLYKVARKHAGGAGEGGFAISMPTLFEKSGAEGQYRRFKFELLKIAEKNDLPGYALSVEQPTGKREPALRMARRRDMPAPAPIPAAPHPASEPVPAPKADDTPVDASAMIRRTLVGLSNRATAGFVTDETLARLREECPGWDYQTLHQQFREWIAADESRTPVNYQNAFIGFVQRYDARNRYTLGR